MIYWLTIIVSSVFIGVQLGSANQVYYFTNGDIRLISLGALLMAWTATLTVAGRFLSDRMKKSKKLKQIK